MSTKQYNYQPSKRRRLEETDDTNIADQLEQIARLKQQGILSDVEFKKAKRIVLGSYI